MRTTCTDGYRQGLAAGQAEARRATTPTTVTAKNTPQQTSAISEATQSLQQCNEVKKYTFFQSLKILAVAKGLAK